MPGYHIRLVTTATTSTSSAARAMPLKKYTYATAAPAVKSRAPYIRKTAAPVAKASAIVGEDADRLVDPTESETAMKDASKSSDTVESMREAAMDSVDDYEPIPEVPLPTPARTKAPTLGPRITSNSHFPSVPFPLASGPSITSTSVISPTMIDNLSISATPSGVDWTTSFHGMSAQPFSQRAAELLMKPLRPDEIEIKPGPYNSARLNTFLRC